MTTNEDLRRLIEDMQSNLGGKMDGITGRLTSIDNELKDIKQKNLMLEAENKSLRAEVALIKKEINRIASKGKEKNIIFFNVLDNDDINSRLTDYVQEVIKKCGVILPEDGVSCVERVGRQEGKRPIRVTLSNFDLKKKFFDKATEFKNNKVFISSDLTELQRMERKKALDTQKLLKTFNIQSKIRGSNLMIENEEYSIQSALNLIRFDEDVFLEPKMPGLPQTPTASRKRTRKTFLQTQRKLSKTDDPGIKSFFAPINNNISDSGEQTNSS